MLKGTTAAVIGVGALTGSPKVRANAVQEDEDADLPKEVIISAPGSDEYHDYTFEVTGDLEELEPNEDRRHAVDEVTDQGDRVRVEGTVGPGDDRFAFSGELNEVDVPSEVRIEVRDRADRRDASPAVLEDFEGGTWPDDWLGETNGYGLTDDALDGESSLVANGSLGYPNVREPTVETPRDNTYTVRTVPGSSGASPVLLTNCQHQNVLDDCYAAWLRTDQDELRLEVRSGGSGTALETVSTSQSLEPGSEYILALDVGIDWVQARAFAGDGTRLAATIRHLDATHGGGTLGLYTDGTAESVDGTRYDEFVQRLLGTV